MRAGAIPLLLLFAAVGIGYGTALRNDLVWDDRIHILESPAVREARFAEIATRPVGSYYRPVVFASFAVEARAGASPALFHATNLVLHALAASLLLAAARALGAPRGAALGGALLFALHPVNSEAVLYVSGRTDVLGAALALAALWLHARVSGWRGAPAPAGARPGAALCFALARPGAALCFALALGCKESLAVLPVALAAGDRIFGPARPGALRRLWPYALVLAAYAGWRAVLAGPGLAIGGSGDLAARLAAALAALADYARLLVLPVGLHLERFASHEPAWRPLAGLLVLAAGATAAWRAQPAIRFWMAWAAIAYLPTSNLVPVYPGLPAGIVFAPEHFLYLPSSGLSMALALAAAPRLPPRAAAAGLAALSLAFAALLQQRARDWRDEETLYTHTLARVPESARVRLNLGNLLLSRGEVERAAAEFEAGLAYHPDDAALLTNAGLAWLALGRFEAGEGALRRAVAANPRDAQPFANLGALYGTTGRWDEARRAYAEALARDPGNADARAGLRILDEIRIPPGSEAE